MNDNTKKILVIKILKLVIFALICIQALFAFQINQTQKPTSETTHSRLIFNKSIDMLKSISQLNIALTACIKNETSCNHAQTKFFTTGLYTDISEFMELAAAEKKLISTVSMHTFDQVKVHINQYHDQTNATTLQQQLSLSLGNIVSILDNLIVVYEKSLEEKEQTNFMLLLIINISLLLVASIYYFYSNKYIQKINNDTEDITKLFHHVLDSIKDLDLDLIRKRLSSISTNPNEKKIYSMLLFSFERLEGEKLKTDLYQRLYSLLGNEIRGITNTIQGGVKLLVTDKDERELLLAKDVITATHTLENLAENFNQLSSIDVAKTDNIVDFTKLSSDLIVLLASKSKAYSKNIECYVDSTLPLTFYGHQTGLFWLLLMQMSDSLSTQGYQDILLTIDCTATKRADQLKINLTFYLYSTEYKSLESIKALPWESSDKALVTNKALARTLIGKIKNYQVTRQIIDNTSRFTTSFDIQPEQYQTQNNLLIDKKILVCGASAMQTNVLNKMLADQGAEVLIAHTPNDIFKSIPLLNNHDGILLTNTISGVKINAFCKIIKARLGAKNIKLFLSVSTSNEVKEVFEHIDYVFYHPCPPSDFISIMLEHLEIDKQDKHAATDKLLIVEDDKLQQFILKKILSDFEYECDTMDDGQQVIDNLADIDHNVIFMDCIMPNLSGVDTTKRIRTYEKQHKQQHRIIIGVTALTSNEEHKLCIDAGMDYVIHKPYKKDDIYSSLKKYLAIRKIQ